MIRIILLISSLCFCFFSFSEKRSFKQKHQYKENINLNTHGVDGRFIIPSQNSIKVEDDKKLRSLIQPPTNFNDRLHRMKERKETP